MLPSVVKRARCPRCEDGLEFCAFSEAPDGHIKDGLASCLTCRAGYPIDDELLLLAVPALMPETAASRFSTRYQAELRDVGVSVQFEHIEDGEFAAQREQRTHFEWYAENETQDYLAYALSSFWRAADELAFERWKHELPPHDWLLDVGAANGRATFPMATPGSTVVGLDISEALLRQAVRRSYANGTHARTAFLVADGDHIPFKDATFDRVMTYGVLHHLPNPGKSCKEFRRILSPDGIYLGSENNDTILRPVFDLLMRLRPLWWERAGAEPLISKARLQKWHEEDRASIRVRYSVFLPPHLFNLLGQTNARILMQASDAVLNALPLVRQMAGLILYEVSAGKRSA